MYVFLEKFYKAARENKDLKDLKMPNHKLLYAKAALEFKFKRQFSEMEVYNLLKEEGLLK